MNNNERAIINIETMAHNVAAFVSFFDKSEDLFGEIDEAVQAAENALLHLAEVMKRF